MRINFQKSNPEALQAMYKLHHYTESIAIEASLRELIKIRASQLNKCAFCLDMHVKDALKLGEAERRIHLLSVWKDTTLFTEREQAVLSFTEAITQIGNGGVSDEVFTQIQTHFDEKQIVDLIMIINAINAWNRLAVTCHTDLPEQ